MAKAISKSRGRPKKKPIQDVGAKLGIAPQYLLPFGHDKAKISSSFGQLNSDKPNGKLILVTSVNPTPAGEGKNHYDCWSRRWTKRYWKECHHLHSGGVAWTLLWNERWGSGRWLRASGANGGYESPLHGRFSCHNRCAQLACSHDP